jgi:putative redox protein
MKTITADLVSGYRVDITNGRHRWVADEPGPQGGGDEGPSPYDLLLGAVAACTAITVSMYAARKGIALDSVSARYSFDRIHADDSDECDVTHGEWLHQVTSEIFIDGDFTPAERDRLSDVARRCPVHRTLEEGISFIDEVVVG